MANSTAAGAVEAGHGASEAAAGAVGMPQLDFATWPNQFFWLAVTLVVIYLLLTRLVLPRIGAVLAERSGTITNDLAAAQELKQQAVAAEQAYTEALAAARAEAGRIVAAAKAQIEKDLAAAIAKADAEIAARAAESEAAIAEIRAGAQASVTEVAREVAREVIAVLGGAVDAHSVTAAVSARLKG